MAPPHTAAGMTTRAAKGTAMSSATTAPKPKAGGAVGAQQRDRVVEFQAAVLRCEIDEVQGQHPGTECKPEQWCGNIDHRHQGQDEEARQPRQVVGELASLPRQRARHRAGRTLVVVRATTERFPFRPGGERPEERACEQHGDESERPQGHHDSQNVQEEGERRAEPVQPARYESDDPFHYVFHRAIAGHEQQRNGNEAERHRRPNEAAQGLGTREPRALQEAVEPGGGVHHTPLSPARNTSTLTRSSRPWTLLVVPPPPAAAGRSGLRFVPSPCAGGSRGAGSDRCAACTLRPPGPAPNPQLAMGMSPPGKLPLLQREQHRLCGRCERCDPGRSRRARIRLRLCDSALEAIRAVSQRTVLPRMRTARGESPSCCA